MRKEARHPIGGPGFEKPSRNMVHIGGSSAANGSVSSLMVCNVDLLCILLY